MNQRNAPKCFKIPFSDNTAINAEINKMVYLHPQTLNDHHIHPADRLADGHRTGLAAASPGMIHRSHLLRTAQGCTNRDQSSEDIRPEARCSHPGSRPAVHRCLDNHPDPQIRCWAGSRYHPGEAHRTADPVHAGVVRRIHRSPGGFQHRTAAQNEDQPRDRRNRAADRAADPVGAVRIAAGPAEDHRTADPDHRAAADPGHRAAAGRDRRTVAGPEEAGRCTAAATGCSFRSTHHTTAMVGPRTADSASQEPYNAGSGTPSAGSADNSPAVPHHRNSDSTRNPADKASSNRRSIRCYRGCRGCRAQV